MVEEKKTVLFYPLNSPGHINSNVALADVLKYEYGHRCVFLLIGTPIGNTLAEHGHEVIQLADSNPMEFYELKNFDDPIANDLEAERRGEKKLRVSGSEIWPHLIVRNASLFQMEPVDAFLHSFKIMEASMVAQVRDNHAHVQATIDKLKPSLIIIDAYFIPPSVLKGSVPWVRIFSANPLPLVRSKLPNGIRPTQSCGLSLLTKQERNRLRNNEPEKWAAIVDQWTVIQKKVIHFMAKMTEPGEDCSGWMQMLKDFELPLPPNGQVAHDSEFLNVHTYPKALDYEQDDDLFEYAEREFPVDSLIRLPFGKQVGKAEIVEWERKYQEARAGKKAAIFLSLGSIASGHVGLMQNLVKIAAKDKERLYIVSKGVNGKKYELGENMIGANYLPQTFFLERVDLAIVHGGNNTINECCFNGKPMVVLPVFADQLDNAQRVDDLGLGKRLNLWDEKLEEKLMGAINGLLAEGSNANGAVAKCAAVGKQMRARDEPKKLGFMIDKLIHDQKLDLTFINLCRNLDLPDICKKLNIDCKKIEEHTTS